MGDVKRMAARALVIGDKKAVVHQVMVSVVASCPCGSPVPVVLGSVAAVGACQGCGDQYFVRELAVKAADAGEGSLEISLGRIAKPISSHN